MNIVMLVKDRPRLTHQALWSLAKHTDVDYNVTIIDDGSGSETREMLRMFAGTHKDAALLCNKTSKGITGQARNLGVYWSEQYFGRGDYLYLSDNDVAFLPHWASSMVGILTSGYPRGLRLLGGARHPYHQPNERHGDWDEVDAVAGYSQLMRWHTWTSHGPLDARAPGTGQSEDFAFCQRIKANHGKVGYVTSQVLVDCGLTQTNGTKAIGAESKPIYKGLIYE
jgi:hypothetical protein